MAQLFSLGIAAALFCELLAGAAKTFASPVTMLRSLMTAVVAQFVFVFAVGTFTADVWLDEFAAFGAGFHFMSVLMSLMPNKSPEPTRVGAVSNPRRLLVCIVAGRGWLSFFR